MSRGLAVDSDTVVVVEDEPIIRMIAVEALEDAGYSTVEFGTAEEAIAFCASGKRDIAAVFTDINMPGDLDGLDLVSIVSRTRPHAVLVVSSGRYQERPADLPHRAIFLPKPWRAPELVRAIKGRG